jgi:3-oxoacyl-[acyl-carrier-protein] synthase-3
MMIYQSSLQVLVGVAMTLTSSTTAAFAPHGRHFGGHRTSPILMASGGPIKIRAIGIGSAAPATILTNVDLESVVSTTDEWISSRTGISQRHLLIVDEETLSPQKLSTLSATAASNALTMSGLSPLDIDLIIMCTSSPDDLFGDATTVQAALGCKNAVAFDLTAACSGFLFGTVTAGQFLHNGFGNMKNAIVIGGDALSRWVDWDDRNSCILFGDGAGAIVLTKCDGDESGSSSTSEIGLLGYSMHSNGDSHEDLMCGYLGTSRSIATANKPTIVSTGSYSPITMNGKKVYQFATREVPSVIEEALEAADMNVDQVDWLLLHQANIRIMETVAKRLGLPMEKVITNLKSYGNTSAGSIPLALDEAVRSGLVKKGDVIACAGFGAGLSWGAAIIRWGGDPIE